MCQCTVGKTVHLLCRWNNLLNKIRKKGSFFKNSEKAQTPHATSTGLQRVMGYAKTVCWPNNKQIFHEIVVIIIFRYTVWVLLIFHFKIVEDLTGLICNLEFAVLNRRYTACGMQHSGSACWEYRQQKPDVSCTNHEARFSPKRIVYVFVAWAAIRVWTFSQCYYASVT